MRESCRVPRSRVSTAAATAPQFVWPSTTKRGVCKWRPAYCRLPATSGDITFPATRTMNSSPKPASKISSGGTRESLQQRMVAFKEICEDLLLHGRESRGPGDESFIARFEAQQCFVG